MTSRLLDAPVATLPSLLADLGRVPLADLRKDHAALGETLNRVLPTAEVPAVPEVYLRVNGAGTLQSDEDMARAARVAAR